MIAEYSNVDKKLATNIMKTITKHYQTPECALIEYAPEGILCASEGDGNNGWPIEDYEKETGSWL